MPLADELRAELAAIAPRKQCDRLAQLSGLFHAAGRIHLRGRGEVSLHLDLADSVVARRAFSLLRSFGVRSEIRTYRRRAFEHGTRFQLHVEGAARNLQTLHEAGVLDASLGPLAKPPRRVVARSCCRAAYLRGALLGAGSLSGGASPHLELRCTGREGAEFLAELGAEEAIVLRVHERGRDTIAYAKGRETIEAVLALVGAGSAVLALEERAVLAETRSRANRLANADHANLVRAGRAAHDQLRAIERLQRERRLDELPAPLRELAELRARHPTASLRELARRCTPPTTKASAHRRLAKVVRLAGL